MPPKGKTEAKLSPEAERAAKVAALKEKGNKALTKEDFDTAIDLYTEAIHLDPENHGLLSNRSAAFASARKFKHALEDAERCIAASPTFAKGYFRKGFALENMLLLPEAFEAYKKAVELDAADVKFKESLAELTQTLDDLKLEEKSDASNPDGDKFVQLVQWLKDGGARFPKLYMKFYSEDYRGVHCLARVPTNDTVLYVPLKYIITSEVARASNIGAKITDSRIELRSKHSYIAAYLLQERSLGKASFWAPYLRILPEKYANMPIFFPEDELAWLTGSFTLYKIADRIDSLRREYDNIRRVVPEFNQYSYEDFVWARLVVITRIFGLNIEATKTDGLVPYADMLNHKLPRETKWSFEDSMRGFVITSLKTVGRGEQIYDSYGRKCNNRFFVNYGFALDENEDNEAVLRLQMPKTSPAYNFKLRLLGGSELTARREYQIPASYKESKCREMFGFLRLVHAREEDVLGISSVGVATDRDVEQLQVRKGEFLTGKIEPVALANERAVLKTAAAAAQATLAGFATSLDDDEKLLASGKLEMFSNERNCVVQRLGEKRVLQWFITLNDTVQPLLNKEWSEIKKIAAKASQGPTNTDYYIATVVAPLVKNNK